MTFSDNLCMCILSVCLPPGNQYLLTWNIPTLYVTDYIVFHLIVFSVDIMDGCIALVTKRSPTKEDGQDTWLCISGQENKRRHRHASVLFTGNIKLPNSAFHISKATELISTQLIYFLPYIHTATHIKIEINCFSISQDIYSWKLPNFLHIFLLCTKLQIYLRYRSTVTSLMRGCPHMVTRRYSRVKFKKCLWKSSFSRDVE